MREYILTINPGSISTKIGIFKGRELIAKETISHNLDEIKRYSCINDQLEYRLKYILSFISKQYSYEDFKAIVGRGGLLRPIPSGTYMVTKRMLKDLKEGYGGEHACNLGGQLAAKIAETAGVDAYIVDPVVVDEMEEVAKITGMPEITRKPVFHALNIRAAALSVASENEFKLENENIIAAHMGGGCSICAMKRGKFVDVTNALEEGAFTPERTGSVPVLQLLKLAYSDQYTYEELRKKLVGYGGLAAYQGTNDCRQVSDMAEKGNTKAELLIKAMVYQISKEIGAMSAVLAGKVKCIILTGGVAYDEGITSCIKEQVSFIAPVIIKPGEDELSAMNEGVLRVLSGVEDVKVYENEIINNLV